MNGVPIRLTKDVHGVGVRGMATRVSPDLAEVLFAQGRAEPRELPKKEQITVKVSAAVVIDDPQDPPPPGPDVPLTDKELKLKLKKAKVEVPEGTDRKALIKLFLEMPKKDK